MKQPVMLTILDGFGWREDQADNAVALAQTPNFDRLWQASPHAFLRTCGNDVGLPDGQMGNSEVGHTNIGAGRVVMQELPRIDAAITDGSLATNPDLQRFIAALKQSEGACHLLGLISPGGVHAHQRHVAALATIIADAGVPVFIHAITDGRDTAPESAADCLQTLIDAIPSGAEIATIIGRYYAMDRDNRWERVERAFDLLVDGAGTAATDPVEAVRASYRAAITDEFVKPIVITGYAGISDGDGLLCANFRADRVREILTALLDPGFDGFSRALVPKFAAALGMVPYSDHIDKLMHCLFAPNPMTNLLGEVVARAGKRQLRAAETEKYPHVTYFLNGGRETPFEGEDRIMVPSPKVATYDLQPEMSAPELTEKVVAAIEAGDLDMIVLNFANPDMVGHTGILAAAIKAVETVDTCLGRIAAAIAAQHGSLIVTADHGNCELMRDPATGGPHTAHTLNRVPVLLAGAAPGTTLHDGRLADLAPTILALLGIAQPAEMTGTSLIGTAAIGG
ncbi:MAG: phosphoglycerate mutase (2,3-diphosphoglycerate-independent) [Acidiphilium sp. 37-64-53]|uniref:2,3-bisphosphoglycerate-independent phosphoglycerate mutase n=2 Tax=Acidocellaceae TaxID=3385905 RepID=UPI000BC94837|nr:MULTISPECIES: 2,3-bisphosphoglycerate-independent phosphoglycerate mutase [Acidiphilium]OYW03811.1 MAG: phosphoglycerate mutase (2,3-diphosphoglycerate-independent) [Acidiphilium sp. 37-64-53]OZB28804.1 MAG: phosphoglycerate mutase (2,3-diphosphoglycerate-independent) [Acidiphilium sp. 34-64-41]HQT83501.1 2,3-bisphosphoglycerate-independent phosphoglycerate mutase [Acidiphilium rubrum]